MMVSGLKMLLISGMGLVVYRWLFAKQPFHWVSRLILLGGVVLSISPYFASYSTPVLTYQLPEISAQTVGFIQAKTSQYTSLLSIMYWSGFFVSVCLFVWRLFKVAQLFRRSKKTKNPWNRILLSGGHPCTFIFWTFIPENVDGQLAETISNHERSHAKLLHGLDLIILELYSIVFWWNPFAYMVKRSIVLVHEYQADRMAAKVDGNRFYLEQMLSFQKWKGSLALTTSVNPLFIQLKNRINMLQKINVHPLRKWMGMVLVPITFMALVVVACNVEPPMVYDTQKLDEKPEYEGGFNELVNYISENLKYPEAEKSAGTEETIHVQFTVSEKGRVVKPEVVKGENENFKEAAIAIFDKMPNWQPGKLNGQAVAAKMVLPIKFAMGSEKIDAETVGE